MAITRTGIRGKSSVIPEVRVLSGLFPPEESRMKYVRRSSVPLVGGGLSFGWVNFDAAFEMSAVLNADART